MPPPSPPLPRNFTSRLYVVRVDIYEAASRYAFPIVTHTFRGRNKQEAWRYHNAHRENDSFLRQCEDNGRFGHNVQCRAVVTEGWR